MIRLIKKVQAALQPLISFIQKIVVTAFLALLYGIGLGVTFVFAGIFNRRLLGKGSRPADSFWKEATGYETDGKESARQS